MGQAANRNESGARSVPEAESASATDDPSTRFASEQEFAPEGGRYFALLAVVLEELGGSKFPAALARLMQEAGGYETTVIAAFPESGRPVRLFSNLSPEDEETTLRPYFDNTYLLDTWYNMARGKVADGVYRLEEHVPDNFRDTDYYRNFYAATGLRDECGVFVRLSEQICIVAMLGIRSEGSPPGNLRDINLILPCIAPIARRHWAGLSTLTVTSSENLETLCSVHGLVGREIEVTDRLLRGYSNKLIGRELGISPETVKVYRKRINKKLGTTSAREVFAMFFRKAI
ncbi:helix-turn-helix domain-containing protein [Novosphingobium taihuense]|uniref:DNA-binding CsgD family transcriptional regulator n=1 Tax=Novosphingobium taihuense TaxID=260085 RepID=A0A7W7ADB2_9SPHN|nr:helix-turn-helix transcriptional regulator [Novosphingobium taihuense]MBB4614174.1 DNA-binding CsgD family transcriptional regulator [Novosphingobium taihuense]TWH87024.1 DNA-binding CsgD family transcriptional regulator [Novosphingobium taihuense]